MIGDRRVLAVVPARSGSKGIADKNMQQLGGKSLIARAAEVLRAPACSWVDRAIISTDSPVYASEGVRHGLEAPFLRPATLSGDVAGAVETVAHALKEAQAHYGERYDVVLIIEPTSPFRLPEDLLGAVELLLATGADSVVSVSRVNSKFHPKKLLRMSPEGELTFYSAEGPQIQQRQSLTPFHYRNGVCYALTSDCLIEKNAIITTNSRGFLIDHFVMNIDEPEELEISRRMADVFLANGAGDRIGSR